MVYDPFHEMAKYGRAVNDRVRVDEATECDLLVINRVSARSRDIKFD